MTTKPSKILVIQTAFLGDIILTTAFLRQLRRQEPEAEITLLTTKAGGALLSDNPWFVNVRIYDKRGEHKGFLRTVELARKLRAQKYDRVYCLHRSLRSSILAFATGAATIFGFQEAAGLWAYTHTVSRAKHLYESEKNLAMLPGTFSLAEKLPELPVAAAIEMQTKEWLREFAIKEYAVLAPSSVWATKRWLPEYFGKLANYIQEQYGIGVVLVAGSSKTDQQVAQQVQASAPNVLNLSGKTSFDQLKAVLKRARFLVANDSAPLHMAVAVGTPVIGLFGPTTKELGFFPLAMPGKAFVLEEDLACRPCGLHGHHKCPLQHHRCMHDLLPERAQTIVDYLMRG